MGLAVLVFMFGLVPSSPPVDVMLIITSVVLAAAVLQSSGGMDFLVSVAEKILRNNPKYITFLAPLVSYIFTFMAGTGNVAFAILPVIAEVARESGVRPERPISISVIASQQAITASPISAAMAALVAMITPLGFGMGSIMLVCVPSTLCGIMAGALYANFQGKELLKDPEYLRRLEEGLVKPPASRGVVEVTKEAYWSVWLFLAGAVLIVLMGTIPALPSGFCGSGQGYQDEYDTRDRNHYVGRGRHHGNDLQAESVDYSNFFRVHGRDDRCYLYLRLGLDGRHARERAPSVYQGNG